MVLPNPFRCLRRLSLVLLLLTGAALPGVAQVTETPHTLAPGRVRVEVDGLSLSFDRRDRAGNTYDALAIASTFLSAGITPTFDLAVGVDLFLREKVEFRGGRDSSSGLGDVTLRPKWTFWRDEKAGAAAAIMPYVKLPTGSGGVGGQAAEGGIIVPWVLESTAGFKAGAMGRWDVVRNDADNGYDSRWLVTGYAIQELTKAFSVYAETTATLASTGFSDSAATLGAGVLWQFSKSLGFDYEVQRGLNRRAAAWTHTWRVNWDW